METYTFVDVLEGRVSPQAFEDKVVVIGATALGLDDWVTPFDVTPPASGVYLHSALVDNLIARRWLRPAPGAWPSALVLALGLSLSLQRVALGTFPCRQGALAGGLLIGWWGVALGLVGVNLWLPVVGPGLMLAAVGGLSLGQELARQNRWIQSIATGLRSRHRSELVLPRALPPTQPGVGLTPDHSSSLTQLVTLTEQLGRSQAIQAAIARSLPQALVAAGGEGIVWFANPLATEWLGVLAGDDLATALVPTWFERDAWQQIWTAVIAGQPLPPQIKAQIKAQNKAQSSPEGEAALPRWYELRVEPIGADQSSPAHWPQGAILLMDDVTYRQRMEADLRRLNSSLEEQVRVRTHQLEQLNQSLQEQIAERQLAQHQLTYEALHDPLTGLPNRRQFLTHLNTQLDQPEEDLYAVLFLDCDRFKLINDSFGHSVGDELLKAVGDIVQDCVRPTDVVARFGGDEFVILLVQINQVEDAIAVAQRIRQRFAEPLDLQGHQLFTNSSIGIVIGGPQYQDSADLLRDADTAMYQAKVNGQGYALFEPGMHLNVRRSLQIQTALRLALDRREFQLHYQPILSLRSGQLMGCEALVRWLHPERGLLLPGDFLAIAEDAGLMAAIGAWVLQEACAQMQRWRHRGLMPSDAVVSVNLSASQFSQPDLVAQIDAVLTSSGLPAANLKLEITETAVIQNADQAIPMLVALRDRGISLSLDDFGIGYSSLGYLQKLPVDMLKIDRSFISDIHSNPRQHGIVETIIRLATHLDIQVIAEGIEQISQLQSLSQLGCEFGQGFLFARPLSVSQFSQYLRRQGHRE